MHTRQPWGAQQVFPQPEAAKSLISQVPFQHCLEVVMVMDSADIAHIFIYLVIYIYISCYIMAS